MRSFSYAFLGIVGFSLIACRHGGTKDEVRAGPSAAGGKDEIALSSDLMKKDSPVGAAWMAYGLSKQAVLLNRPSKNPLAGVDDFDTEYQANKDMVFLWTALAPEKHATDRYLDTLVAVNKAGFLAEYVLAVFSRPGWTIPAKYLPELHFSKFFAWSKSNLNEIEVPSLVRVSSSTLPQHPRVAGATLPDPEAWTPGRVPCAQSLRPLQKAHDGWLAEREKLEVAPFSVESRQQFLALLEWAAEHVQDYPRGVVWVSPKALAIGYYAGFCAVDVSDHRLAIAVLREAVSLAPLFPKTRAELAQALTASKQLPAALEETDQLLTVAKGKCDLGMAWRKRGFILFEMGKLKEAYLAYQKSREFDPSSKIAYDELRILASELLRTGQLTEGDKGHYTPPPALGQVTTHCTEKD